MATDTPTLVVDAPLTEVESAQLTAHEAVIDRGVKTFIEVGGALAEIRDGRLYRQTHETFEDYCGGRWNMSIRFAQFQMRGADTVKRIASEANNCSPPANEAQARPLAKLPDEHQAAAWREAVDTAPDGKVTAAHVERVADQYQQDASVKECPDCGKSYVFTVHGLCPYCNKSDEARARGLNESRAKKMDVHYSSDSPEWYTPRAIIDATVALMGGIDLDPCSNGGESPSVPAEFHYTKSDDGLAQQWTGRVYMNPPYGREIGEWTNKLKAEHESGRVSEAVALVPSRTDTEWMNTLRDYPRCFVRGRLKFSEHENSAPFPSVVFYFGENVKAFARAFDSIGDVYVRYADE